MSHLMSNLRKLAVGDMGGSCTTVDTNLTRQLSKRVEREAPVSAPHVDCSLNDHLYPHLWPVEAQFGIDCQKVPPFLSKSIAHDDSHSLPESM